jgi:hypothetical protein
MPIETIVEAKPDRYAAMTRRIKERGSDASNF